MDARAKATALEILQRCTVKRTNKNSHIVFQILTPEGLYISGPPEEHNGTRISGRAGWKLKRDAVAALEKLKEIYKPA